MKFIKDFFAEIVIGLTVAILATAIAFAISGCMAYAAINAPERVKPGELIKVTSDTEADWIVQPDEYRKAAYVDSNKKTLVLLGAKQGTVYVFAATVVGGEPKAYCWKVEVTEQAPEQDDVIPVPPEPVDVVFPQTVTDAIDSIDSPNKEKEVTGLLDVLKSTIAFIDNGSVTSTAGARETIRRNWTIKAANVSADTEQNWAPVLTEIFKPLSINDVKSIRENLLLLVKAMEK